MAQLFRVVKYCNSPRPLNIGVPKFKTNPNMAIFPEQKYMISTIQGIQDVTNNWDFIVKDSDATIQYVDVANNHGDFFALRNRDSNIRWWFYQQERGCLWVQESNVGCITQFKWSLPKKKWRIKHFSIRCRRCWWKQSTGGVAPWVRYRMVSPQIMAS